jgi:murein L,D-transpeptidase YcbB/YkuD
MYRVALILLIFVWGSVSILCEGVLARSLSKQVTEILRNRITIPRESQHIVCRAELLCGSDVLPRFYYRRGFQPAWITDDGRLSQAMILVNAIHEARSEGLRPADYHLGTIEALVAQIRYNKARGMPLEANDLADLDFLLTDAFLIYGSHLLKGRVNPETIHSEWFVKNRDADLPQVLQSALDADQINRALESLRPQHAGYIRLKRALMQYRDILQKEGLAALPRGPTLQRGDQGMRVASLRSRLTASGDLDGILAMDDEDLFNEILELAVHGFQRRHGLRVDGIVGPATLKALNVPMEERVRQIELNLERWRWLPHDFGHRYILVNAANFKLDVVENGRIIMTMRIVVGRRFWHTPVFSGQMTYLELNPYWHVPQKIASMDLLPKIKEDPNYLTRQNIRVFQSWDARAPEIQPESVDWTQITEENLFFKLRQEPGPKNALGRVKFMFPNKFGVYIHDTPAKGLFQRLRRDFSAGCIRIEKPFELLAYLLRSDPRWTREKIIAAINSRETQIVPLPEPIPVHLLYWTAWVDESGKVHFREDIYGRDKPLDEALNEPPPTR